MNSLGGSAGREESSILDQPYGIAGDQCARDRLTKLTKLLVDEVGDLLNGGETGRQIRVLEVGCGDGFFLESLRDEIGQLGGQKPARVRFYGLEISGEAVEKCRRRGFSCEQCDLNERISYDDRFFDIVFSSEVIEHVVNTDMYVAEIKRVLKDRATLVVTTPNLAAWFNRILLMAGFQPIHTETSMIHSFFGKKLLYRITGRQSRPVGHVRPFVSKALVDCLTYYGFQVQNIQGYYYHPIPLNRMISHLSPSLADGIIVTAKNELSPDE